MEDNRGLSGELDRLIGRFLDFLARHQTVIWSLVVGFCIAMFMFAEDGEIEEVIIRVLGLPIMGFGAILIGVGCRDMVSGYEGKPEDTWLEKNKEQTLLDRAGSVLWGCALLIAGLGTVAYGFFAILGP